MPSPFRTFRLLTRLTLTLTLPVLFIVTAGAGEPASPASRVPRRPPISTGRARVEATLPCPSSCNDFNACTVDSCDGTSGTCRHDPMACDDGNPCTLDFCEANGFTPHCVYSGTPFDGTPCDDGNACTLDETCSSGQCRAGTELPAGSACDDGDVCTGQDVCVGGCTPSGCSHCVGTALSPGTRCDDGNPCTGADACDDTHRCTGTPVTEGSGCDDADACTRDDRCIADTGVGARCAGTPLDCHDADLCTQDRCDPATGECSHPPVDCEDGNSCTTDTCDPASGCRRDNAPGTCNDGTGCTSGDACTGGNCIGQPVTCPTLGCSVGHCDPLDGLNATCRYHDDPSLCTARDQCSFSECRNGSCRYVGISGTRCDLGPGSCSIGLCVRGDCRPDVTFPCNDNNPCTADVCSSVYTCNPTPMPDGTSCRLDACSAGTCRGGVCGDVTTTSCDDFNPCTVDSCDSAGGCVHSPVVCDDDHNPCTRDICSTTAGACIHDPQSGTLCADDGCSRTYCQNGACSGVVPNTCDDHDSCTVDHCEIGAGCMHDRTVCDDGNACTTDNCTSTGACQHLPLAAGSACNDHDPCTALDSCKAVADGVACTGTPLTCFDGNPCTDDIGVAQENTCLCDYIPRTDACCSNGGPISCDDGNACTADRCDPASGCVHDGPAGPAPETCNGLDDDCDGAVDERETVPLCTVLPYNVRDSMATGSFFVLCRLTPSCAGSPPPPLEPIGTVWLSAADLLFSQADNAQLPDLADCQHVIVENPVKRMLGPGAVTFVFDATGNGVCGTSGGGRAGLVRELGDVPDGKLARVCVKWRHAPFNDIERCGTVVVRHDASTGPQPVMRPPDDEGLLRPAP